MQRHRSARREWWIGMALGLLCAAAFLTALGLPLAALADTAALTAEEVKLIHACESGELIRLHVLADGDDAQSQRVKLAVRDALIDAFGKTLIDAAAADADAAYAALLKNVSAMEDTARECARRSGFKGSVRAEAGILTLPAKTYGRVVLPQGEYRALRVTLGSGEGKNWFCVLFPQLCLSLAGEDGAAAAEPPELIWDTERIFSKWLIWPCDSPDG